jgi:V/A-type H+-transporting ATPase subunit B
MSGRPRPARRGEIEYRGADHLEGPLVVIEGARGAAYNETVEVIAGDGSIRVGQVLEVNEDRAVIEIFGDTAGLEPTEVRVRLQGRPLHAPVAREMLGRIFDGLGRPVDGLPDPLADHRVDVHGAALNPSARAYPRSHIETGVSAIDGMNTLVRGQKLPVFSGSGLPHDQLTAQIAAQARVSGEGEEFALVFAALGVSHDTARAFRETLTKSGSLHRAALFLNFADDPPVERIITPRIALSLAEFLGFEREMHVLVILTDMTNYGEALRELSNRREEVPTRKGFPGYLYSDLASLYERCGRVRGRNGSITLMPVLTMPNDDITHPIPDLTGYITEGQVVLARELARREFYPPIDVLASLSRLMKDGIGEDETRADHQHLSNQLYSSYARVREARHLADIIGEEDLPGHERVYLEFGERFERDFLDQGAGTYRTLEETLDRGWSVLATLPRDELTRVSEEELEAHYDRDGQEQEHESESGEDE